MGVYIGLTLLGENKWSQVFRNCRVAAAEPHPPTQDSLPRLLSHSVRGKTPPEPRPGLGARAWDTGRSCQPLINTNGPAPTTNLSLRECFRAAILSVSNCLHTLSQAFLTTGILNFIKSISAVIVAQASVMSLCDFVCVLNQRQSPHCPVSILGCTHTRQSVPCPSTFDPQSPVHLTSVITLYHAWAWSREEVGSGMVQLTRYASSEIANHGRVRNDINDATGQRDYFGLRHRCSVYWKFGQTRVYRINWIQHTKTHKNDYLHACGYQRTIEQ
ncbi:uncharacterized protein LOC127428128 [Myxocyprinus asiaticus]|uniref:uncharacterized protein LOC127428128 n=1 Tax=Myxocyprinus asiaticus TaxID=70543 RepID=UPI002221ADE4|nr:uncharacterized protein LOC127428128 [Myxocyprinus asiaticus]